MKNITVKIYDGDKKPVDVRLCISDKDDVNYVKELSLQGDDHGHLDSNDFNFFYENNIVTPNIVLFDFLKGKPEGNLEMKPIEKPIKKQVHSTLGKNISVSIKNAHGNINMGGTFIHNDSYVSSKNIEPEMYSEELWIQAGNAMDKICRIYYVPQDTFNAKKPCGVGALVSDDVIIASSSAFPTRSNIKDRYNFSFRNKTANSLEILETSDKRYLKLKISWNKEDFYYPIVPYYNPVSNDEKCYIVGYNDMKNPEKKQLHIDTMLSCIKNKNRYTDGSVIYVWNEKVESMFGYAIILSGTCIKLSEICK